VNEPLPVEGIILIEPPLVKIVADELSGKVTISGAPTFAPLLSEIAVPEVTVETIDELAPRLTDEANRFNTLPPRALSMTLAARFMEPGMGLTRFLMSIVPFGPALKE